MNKDFNITAQEAAEISSENKDALYRDERIALREIEKRIIKAAKYGDCHIKIDYSSYDIREEKIAEILREKGFKIEFGFYHTCWIGWGKEAGYNE